MRKQRRRERKQRAGVRTWLLVWTVALCLVGCAKSRAEKVEITLIHGWGSTEADHVAMRQIYQDFEKEHPHIKLNLVSMPSADDVITKVEDMLSVGEIPDIVFTAGVGRDTVYEFMVENHYAVDLMPYVEADPLFRENISESILDYWTLEGNRLYTVSDVLLMAGYWYNEEIFAQAGLREPPATWQEFILVCERLQEWAKEENRETVPIILDEEHIMYLTNVMLAQTDPGILAGIQENQIDVYADGFTQMLEWMKELSSHAVIPDNYTYRDTLRSFNNEETAIYINGVWANSMIDAGLEVSYAAFPYEDGTGISNISSCVGYILGESGDAGKVEASVEFIKYMLSEPVARQILTQTGQIPSNPKVEIEQTKDNERLYQAVSCVKQAGHTMEIPDNIWDSSLKAAYGENISKYLKGEIALIELSGRLESE